MLVRAWASFFAGAAACASAAGIAPSAPTGSANDGPVQTATQSASDEAEQEQTPRDIIVNGRLPHCRARPGDPLDAVDVSAQGGVRRQRTIAPDPHTGVLRMVRDNDPITGPDTWQRVGTGLDHYIFRAPPDGGPLCIGARGKAPVGFAQLRRELDAKLFTGRYVRFTVWATTRRVGIVKFWVAIGDDRGVLVGEDSSAQPLQGDRSWTPVSIILGPVLPCATKLSYGVVLDGPGDVWLARPALDIIPRPPGAPAEPRGLDPHCKAAAKAREE